MKKGILAISLVCLLFLAGCGKAENKENSYEKVMEQYAKIFYEDNMKNVVGQNTNQVSIASLKAFNKAYGEKYDLSKLKDCKDSSYTSVIVDSKSREIKKYEHHLECK